MVSAPVSNEKTEEMKMTYTIHECGGGFRIDNPDGWPCAIATQRDPHPTRGGGITWDQARATAERIAAALNETRE